MRCKIDENVPIDAAQLRGQYDGIVVSRPVRSTAEVCSGSIGRIVPLLDAKSLAGALCIVDENRVLELRMHRARPHVSPYVVADEPRQVSRRGHGEVGAAGGFLSGAKQGDRGIREERGARARDPVSA